MSRNLVLPLLAAACLTPAIAVAQAIAVDHTCTDASQIPDYWMSEARKLAVHYAYTSHGSQIISGLEALELIDPVRYAFDRIPLGATQPTALSCGPDSLCIYSGSTNEQASGHNYVYPSEYWETLDGRTGTEGTADTGLFDASGWAWCGQASYYDPSDIASYLGYMGGWDTAYPPERFFLMTGHPDNDPSSNLIQNNTAIRQYATDNQMLLFDFADIDSYSPDGTYYANEDGEGCNWCADWCTSHPEDCTSLPGSCSHSHGLICYLKGQAFWWLMARLAGWNGDPDLVFADGFESGGVTRWSTHVP